MTATATKHKKNWRGCATPAVWIFNGGTFKVGRGSPGNWPKSCRFRGAEAGLQTTKPPNAGSTTKYIIIENYTPYCPINKGPIHHRTVKGCWQPRATQHQKGLGECAHYFVRAMGAWVTFMTRSLALSHEPTTHRRHLPGVSGAVSVLSEKSSASTFVRSTVVSLRTRLFCATKHLPW